MDSMARATARKSSPRAMVTALAASKPEAAVARRSSSASVTPGLRKVRHRAATGSGRVAWRPCPGPAQLVVVPEPHEGPPDEGVRGIAVGEVEVRGLVAVQEGAELVEGPDPFGTKSHDHPPMISSPRASGSPLLGKRLLVQADLSLDKSPVSPAQGILIDCPHSGPDLSPLTSLTCVHTHVRVGKTMFVNP